MIKYGTNNIGSLYFGSNPIGKAYLGSNLVFQRGGGPGPQPTTIAYIRGGADGSYIDTGITADNTTRVVVWARNFNTTVTLFGSRVGSGNAAFSLLTLSEQNTGRFRFDYAGTMNTIDNAFPKMSHYYKYELDGNVFKINDTVISTATATTFSNQRNIYLLGINNNGVYARNSHPIDICSCQIYKNGTLVRNYTAVNSPSVGLYDSVSQTLFTNAGSGSLTYGTFNQNAYTPLEYVEFGGNSYFDTGIKASNSLDSVCKYRPALVTTYPWLYGAQTSKNTNAYGLAFGDATITSRAAYFVYGSQTLIYNSGSAMNGSDYVFVKSGTSHSLYLNYNQLTSQSSTAATFTNDYNLYVGCFNAAGEATSGYNGRLYYLNLGNSRNFVPALVNNVAGMYDTYNDNFYPSLTAPLTAGTIL